MEKVKTIFIGTSEFAVPILDALVNLDFIDLQAIVTQPDRPAGRKQELVMPAVKKYFLEKAQNSKPETRNIELYQPVKFKELQDELIEKFQPELIIVASYGQIIPRKAIAYPKYGCLNIHGSILPKLRGAVPVQMSILQGFETTGVTLQKMVFEMDEGPIIATRELKLLKTETTESLFEKLESLSVDLINLDLKKWIGGEIKAIPQNDSEATYCYQKDIAKENAEIKFSDSVEKVDRMIRAFYPWPVAWITIKEGRYEGKRLKIFNAVKIQEAGVGQTVSQESEKVDFEHIVISQKGNQLILNLTNGALELLDVQLEGKKRLTAKDYLYLAE